MSQNHLTKLQLKEIREAFDLFDRDKSGTISKAEMNNVFKALGIKASSREIELVIMQMDTDGDGEISFDEFARVMGAQFLKKNTPEEIKAAFSYFDKDNDGYISTSELRTVLSKMGRAFTEAEIERMIKSIDRNGDGQISIDEFAQLLE